MKSLFISLSLFLSLPLFAQTDPSTVRAMLTYGSEFRPSRSYDGKFKDQVLGNYSLGVGYRKMIFILERAQFEESSGNATLQVKRNFENTMLWLQWRAQKLKVFAPFIAGGIGAYKETVETVLLGSSATNETPHKFLSGAAAGVSLDVPVLWLSLEARMLFGDEIDPQPTLGGLARIGVWF